MFICVSCQAGIDDQHTLCPECELRFAIRLLWFIPWLAACREFLDSTAHYGGHAPERVNLPTAPTPIRLEVLDHLDLVSASIQGLWRRLQGVDPLDWQRDMCPDVEGCLLDAAAHPRLGMLPDIGMWLDEFRQLEAKTLNIIDVPENMRIIGRCLNSLCGVELKAPIGATEATCRMCGSTWQVKDVRLALLRSFLDSGKAFPAGECASLLRECGLAANGNTIRSWHRRKLLEPAGIVGNKPVYRLRDVHRLLMRHAE